ncbi:hypothetical protein, partial [uncultured Bilophila sp.]
MEPPEDAQADRGPFWAVWATTSIVLIRMMLRQRRKGIFQALPSLSSMLFFRSASFGGRFARERPADGRGGGMKKPGES